MSEVDEFKSQRQSVCVGGCTFSVYGRYVAPVVSLDNVHHSSCLLGI